MPDNRAHGRVVTVHFQKPITLNNGRGVKVKLMTREDRAAVLEFFDAASDEDCRFLKRDVKNSEMVDGWMDNLDHRQVMPIGAFEPKSNRLIGYALVVVGRYSARHRAELEIFVAPDYRHLGLGSAMAREAIILSQQRDIQVMRAEVPYHMRSMVKGLRRLGFELKCTLEDYFMDQSGETHDVALMVFYLITATSDEFFYTF